MHKKHTNLKIALIITAVFLVLAAVITFVFIIPNKSNIPPLTNILSTTFEPGSSPFPLHSGEILGEDGADDPYDDLPITGSSPIPILTAESSAVTQTPTITPYDDNVSDGEFTKRY